MEMAVDNMDSGVTCVNLKGSFDIAGAEAIDMQMSVVAGKSDKVLIDMAEVSFMASIGVRTLVKAAKAITRRGGSIVVARPIEAVAKVLRTTGVDTMIPIHDEVDAAMTALAPS